jgi:transmembrane sensor
MQTSDAISMDGGPRDDLAGQATLWVVRLTSGETTAEERLAFQRWRDESPAHAAALAEARRLWLSMGPALEPAGRHQRAALWRARPPRLVAVAASIVACVFVGAHYVDNSSHDYVTGAGERRTVDLSDGTQVLLNSRSALDVSFKDGVRKVTLVRGEAYFDVAHDAARPFTVAAGDGRVRDIGTAFSVRREGDGATVVVARGKVEVDPVAPGGPHPVLSVNQEVAYGGAEPAAVRTVDASRELSWVRGQLILENRSLADSIQAIDRYYSGRLVLINSGAGARRINAVVDLNRIDDWLTALEKTHTAKVIRLGSLVLVY